MKNLVQSGSKSFWAVTSLIGLTAAFGAASARAEEKHNFRVAGTFVEGCSCELVCPCAMGRMNHGCQGVGAMVLTSGSYNDVDLTGAKFVYATAPGGWVRLYIDAGNQLQQEALSKFTKIAFSTLGKIEAVNNAKIELAGKGGRYTLTVDGGKIAQLTTEPVLGADQKTPFTYSNTDIPVSPTLMQGKTIKGSYHDGEHSFTLSGSNSYFNGNPRNSGKI